MSGILGGLIGSLTAAASSSFESIATVTVGSGGAGVAVTASLTGLITGTTYFGRAAGWSAAGGLTFGAEVSFTTL